MNPIMLKLWIEAKRAHIRHCQTMGITYSPDEVKGMLSILIELEDDFNLEQFTEEDFHIEKNF